MKNEFHLFEIQQGIGGSSEQLLLQINRVHFQTLLEQSQGTWRGLPLHHLPRLVHPALGVGLESRAEGLLVVGGGFEGLFLGAGIEDDFLYLLDVFVQGLHQVLSVERFRFSHFLLQLF